MKAVMKDLIFACMAAPGEGAREALLLARSIRQFAGEMAGCSIWVLFPEIGEKITQQSEASFRSLDVRVVYFPTREEVFNFPFGAKSFAAAKAEDLAEAAVANLIWMDSDSIILQEPAALRLPQDKVIGYRPVDHTLIGSQYEEQVDDFWGVVYSLCNVPRERVFPMITSVDEKRIRPYFNAGMMVVRPERRLLRSWANNFDSLFEAPQFVRFYGQDILFRIFLHQAILAGTILANCDTDELHELPYQINYPIHMHDSYPADRRPARVNNLISCRYDTFFQDPAWEDDVAIDEPLRSWLLTARSGG